MAKATSKAVNEADALAKVQPVAHLLGKGAGQIWKIYVRRYVAKGVAEVVGAAGLWYFGQPWILVQHPSQAWRWVIVAISGLLIFDAIQLLINPHYFAMGDVENAIKRNTANKNAVQILNR